MTPQTFAVKYAQPLRGVHLGYWYVYRLADGRTFSTHPSYGSAFHEMEKLERAAKGEHG